MKGNSSKELLYSEYTGTTVAEHVLEILEKRSTSLCEKMDESLKKNKKSETFERVRKLMSFIEKEQDVSNMSIENSKVKSKVSVDTENKEEIEVVMEVDENTPESNVNAWFLLKLPKEQESECSDDELDEDSSSVASEICVLDREKITVLETKPSKHLDNETVKCSLQKTSSLKKRKLCVVEDEISDVCDTENPPKLSLLARRV